MLARLEKRELTIKIWLILDFTEWRTNLAAAMAAALGDADADSTPTPLCTLAYLAIGLGASGCAA